VVVGGWAAQAGPREATQRASGLHVAVQGWATQAGPREATQGAPGPHVAVRGRASQAGPHEAAKWTNRRERGHDCGGHRAEVGGHVELEERGSGRGGKREIRLVENDVTRDEDSVGGEVKTLIPLLVGGVTEEDTASGARGELMRSSGSEIGVESAPDDTKMVVRGMDAEESVVRSGVGNCLGGETVEEVGGSGEGLSPVSSRKRSLEK
jgi:hypothetical protein